MPELAAHKRAQDAFAAVIANVRDDQLDAPTPCAEWTVRD
ncbi:MAG: maleylpyruvate isomerase N-terminal domain-containing protein, partial [Acidimicrobiales bacterium]